MKLYHYKVVFQIHIEIERFLCCALGGKASQATVDSDHPTQTQSDLPTQTDSDLPTQTDIEHITQTVDSLKTTQPADDDHAETDIELTQTVKNDFPGSKAKSRIFEVGCGVGNTVFPVLQTNKYVNYSLTTTIKLIIKIII